MADGSASPAGAAGFSSPARMAHKPARPVPIHSVPSGPQAKQRTPPGSSCSLRGIVRTLRPSIRLSPRVVPAHTVPETGSSISASTESSASPWRSPKEVT